MKESELVRGKKMAVREEKETKRIRARALALARGSEEGAKRLLRGVLYLYYGQTWDESLFCAEDKDDLLEEEDINKEMEGLAKEGTAMIEEELLKTVIKSILYEPAECLLYLGMLYDLLGEAGIEKLCQLMVEWGFEKEVVDDVRLKEEREELVDYYSRTAEKLMAQWDNETILEYLWGAMVAWRYCSKITADPKFKQANEEERYYWEARSYNSRSVLKLVLEQIVERKLVKPGVDLTIGEQGKEGYAVISYEIVRKFLGEDEKRWK